MKTFKQFFIEQATSKTVVFAYGRFNPPTIGHQKLINVVSNLATKHNASGFIIPSHSVEPKKKNPLTFEQKANILQYVLPKNVELGKFGTTFINVLKELQSMGFTNAIQVAGSDRQTEFLALVNKYNGKQDPKTGNIDFNFKSYNVVSSGERDPDSDSVEGMSASKLRMFAAQNNFEEFSKGLPASVPLEVKKETFLLIRKTLTEQ